MNLVDIGLLFKLQNEFLSTAMLCGKLDNYKAIDECISRSLMLRKGMYKPTTRYSLVLLELWYRGTSEVSGGKFLHDRGLEADPSSWQIG